MIADGLSRIAMSTGLAASLSRATEFTRERGHSEVSLEHMLLSLCQDPEAMLVLAASNINVSELQESIEALLDSLPRHGPVSEEELVVAPGMRRILEAAAAAARGGRRREINGAIVLAAIIGDGKSAAADALSALGLTFEGAIRALQSKPAAAPAAPSDARPLPAPDAEAILAGARERVQSRTVTAPPRRHHPEDEETDEHYEAEPRHAEPDHPAGHEHDEASEQEFAQEPAEQPVRPAIPPELTRAPPRAQPAPAPSHPVTNRPQAEYFDEETYDDDHFRHPGPPQQHTYPDQHHADPAHYADDAGGEPYQGHEHHPLPPSPHQEYDDYRPGSHEEHAEHAYAGARPTSAPFPPPVPLPDSDEGWAPPPSMPPAEYAPNGQYPAARGGYAPAQQPPPPAPGSAPRPGPPPLAPWPESEHGGEQAEFEPHFPTHREHMQQPSPADWQAGYPAPAPLPRAEIGQLIENIPRSMRVAVPALIEVRVARADVRALAEGLQGGGAAYQHEVMVTKAMSVRLRAPDGGFFIETASPETQWIERAMLMSSDDFASWRWHVTPRDTGRRRLQLIISARTVSADGLAAETALPDQVISVRVRTNYAQSTKRWLGWGAAAVAGGLLAKFGEGAFASLGGFFG